MGRPRASAHAIPNASGSVPPASRSDGTADTPAAIPVASSRATQRADREKEDGSNLGPLPHPAEDLSSDDDLLSWVLVDQLGCMPNSKLGVHPQENKFVGPKFKTDDVLEIIREVRFGFGASSGGFGLSKTLSVANLQMVVKGHTNEAMAKLQE